MKTLLTLLTSLSTFFCFAYFLGTNDLVVLKKQTYTIGYSTNYHQAIWCEYVLTSNQLVSTNHFKRTDDFRKDDELLSLNITNIIKPKYYDKSGYDKGHLCAAQDRAYDLNAVSETFLMSNMSPQDPGFNRGIWKKLEDWTREFAITNGSDVMVVTGPIIFKRHVHGGQNDILCVPNMYYKILITTNNQETSIKSFLIPNEKLNKTVYSYEVNYNFITNLIQ